MASILLGVEFREMLKRAASGAKTGKEHEALTTWQKDEAISRINTLVAGLKRKQPSAFKDKA